MDFGQVMGLDKPISRMVFGCMRIGRQSSGDDHILMDRLLSSGCNAFDLAKVYGGGDSERVVGEWMESRGNREQLVILTKGCHHNDDRTRVTPFDLLSDFHDSLARLRTGYIDVYLLHRDDLDAPVGPIMETLNDLKARGMVRAFGGSNWSHERLEAANEYAYGRGLFPMTASSPNFSLAEQVCDPWGPGCVTLSGPAHAGIKRWYIEHHMPVFAYSSLGRGFFSGRISRENFHDMADEACLNAYCHEINFQRLDRAAILAAEMDLTVAQVAVAYCMNSPMKVFPIIQVDTVEQFEENLRASEVRLSPETLEWLEHGTERPLQGKETTR